MAREIVRDDQWQEFVDVYVKDKHKLGLDRWFERHNPHALAQSIERMLEAARQQYWQADPKVVAELKARYRDLARRFDVRSDNAAFERFVGYGVSAAAPAPRVPAAAAPPAATPAEPEPAPAAPPRIEGLRLDKVAPPPAAASLALATLLAIALVMVAGGWRQGREPAG